MTISNRTARLVRCGLLGLALLGAGPGWAAGFVGQAYPLPHRVDRERVRTSLLVQFDIERYGQPFAAFAARHLDPFEATFRRFVQALVAGDVAAVAALRPGEAAAQTRALVQGYRGFFEGGERIGVVARVAVGDYQVFVWDWPTPGGRVLQAFAIEGPADKPRVEIVTSNRPVDTLIVDALQGAQRQPDVYAPVAPERRYHFVLPVAGGRPGAHPVVLHFDGAPVDRELFDNGPAPASDAAGAASGGEPPTGRPADALRAYAAAQAAFASRDMERFLGAHTDKSREKLKGWFEQMSPDRFDAYHADTLTGRRVRFVLDADPLVIVFYTRGRERRLYYDHLVSNGRRGYQLTNAYFEDFLDDVLGNDALFATDLESFQKKILGAAPPK